MLQGRIDSFEDLVRPWAMDASALAQSFRATYLRSAARRRRIDWTLPAETMNAVRSLDRALPNPLEVPKVVCGGQVLLVPKLEVLPALSESRRAWCWMSTATRFG
jgi:hypothetical protein